VAEPKPVSEKPNLVAVAADPQAEARPESGAAPQASAGAAAPQAAKAAPASGQATPASGAPKQQKGQATPASGAPKQQKGTRWGMWLLVLLVAAGGVTAWVQTQRLTRAEGRVTALSEQVLGLQSQLSAANTQIHTYEMQRGQVREAVSDIAQRVLMLNELVGGANPPAATPGAETEAETAP
jgi:hypothetical protein